MTARRVVTTDGDVVQVDVPAQTYQVVDFINFMTWLLEGLLIFRLIFDIFAASTAAGFVRFIYNITEPFVVPFRGIFGPIVSGGVRLDPAILMAMIAWLLLAKVLVDLIRIISERRSRIAI